MATAYEAVTHEALSTEAAFASTLAVGSALQDLGLPSLTSSVNYGGSAPTTALSLVQQGAFDEDNFPTSINHFYDPQHLRGLNLGIDVGIASPDWIIADSFPPGIYSGFSYRTAEQEYLLTLTASSVSQRLANAGLMYQSIGHVIHHVQDMAQPAHVRNDTHIHFDVASQNPYAYYEIWTARVFSIDGLTPPYQSSALHNLLVANPYPAGAGPDFATAREFWYSPGASAPAYVGMADFTSRNFVSLGTEYGRNASTVLPNSGFPFPNGSGKVIQSYVNDSMQFPSGLVVTGTFDYVVGTVFDGYTGVTSQPRRLAVSSLLSTAFVALGLNSPWMDNIQVFNDNYATLLPRAVAFSKGLINHLFRGRLGLQRQGASTTWIIANHDSLKRRNDWYLLCLPGRQHEQSHPNIGNGWTLACDGAGRRRDTLGLLCRASSEYQQSGGRVQGNNRCGTCKSE
jgi:hypothetical protein